jgi:hypothetical protein
LNVLPRDHHLRRIETLDPERDYAEIFRLMAFHEFPWDGRVACKLMIWHLYAVPSSGKIMGSTYALVDRPVDRAETTSLAMGDLIEFGFDSPRGRELLRSINRAHREWNISPDDLRFALAALGVLLIRWIDRYGWRAPTENERTATAIYYAELGRRLGAPGLPRRYDDLAAYLAACERDRIAYSEAGRLASERSLELGRSLVPRPFAPLLRPFVMAMLDPRVRGHRRTAFSSAAGRHASAGAKQPDDAPDASRARLPVVPSEGGRPPARAGRRPRRLLTGIRSRPTGRCSRPPTCSCLRRRHSRRRRRS